MEDLLAIEEEEKMCNHLGKEKQESNKHLTLRYKVVAQ
jgi:hypothetical protein